MLTLHLPKNLEQISNSFKHTDPAAWIVLAVAIGSMAVILAATYFR